MQQYPGKKGLKKGEMGKRNIAGKEKRSG